MSRSLLSRDGASFVFMSVMIVSLPLAVLGQIVAIILHRGAAETDIATGADVFGWLFTAAFLLTLLLTVVVEERRLRAKAR